eukprot:Transcript_27237.p1 GENE.Transcript_27237~~Transcript_27237.p1  ORF type:complete len:354 (-),score=76.72 Transcript_27237:78-1082(-)
MSGLTGAPPNDFDYYVLGLEWQPAWALSACPGGHRPNARLVQRLSGESGSYARTRISLHGLWPDYDPPSREGHAWPQWCNTCLLAPGAASASCLDFSSCQERTAEKPECRPAPAVVAAYNTTEAWQRYALEYAWGDLSSHEWAKHGSCSPWFDDAAAYFAAAQAAHAAVAVGRGAALLRPGAAVAHAAVAAAFAAESGGAAPALRCDVGCNVSEVWLGFGRRTSDGGVDLGRGVGMAQADSCLGKGCGTVHLQAWEGCGGGAAPAAPPSDPSEAPPRLSELAIALLLLAAGLLACALAGLAVRRRAARLRARRRGPAEVATPRLDNVAACELPT